MPHSTLVIFPSSRLGGPRSENPVALVLSNKHSGSLGRTASYPKTHPKRNRSDCQDLSPLDSRVFIRHRGMLTLGATLSKATLRMVGTFAGAMIGLAVVAFCAHDRELFVLAMAMVTALCVWGMQTSTHQYAWLLVALTCAIVGWPTAMSPLNTFQTAVERVTAVTVGVVLASLAQGVFWPVTAGGNSSEQCTIWWLVVVNWPCCCVTVCLTRN